MAIRVLYFAGLRDLVGRAEEQLELPADVRTVAQLSEHLKSRHPELDRRLETVRFAVNESFASLGDSLSPGDTVALIPPVAGG